MGLFDIFSNSDAQNAAQAQQQGYQQGNAAYQGAVQQGTGALQQYYGQGIQPNLQNLSNSQAGVGQLMALLGIPQPNTPGANTAYPNVTPPNTVGQPQTPITGFTGNTGSPTAPTATPGAAPSVLGTLQNMPGYQFQLQQGNNAINAAEAASGKNFSGNQLLDLSNYNQGLAGTSYNNLVSQLQPFLGSANTAGSTVGGLYGALGSGVNQNYGNIGSAAYGAAVGQGNAQAQADYANLAQSAQLWNLIGNVAKGGAGLFGGFGGGGVGASSIGY